MLSIQKVHHNRCVVLTPECLAQAEISKGDYVTQQIAGNTIVIRRAKLVDPEKADQNAIETLVELVKSLTPEQINVLQNAIKKRTV
jgi:antitoxin component of MazEF toxin-antitoxin module